MTGPQPPFRESTRFALALAGILLWLAYPVFFMAGNSARHDYRCAGRHYAGHFDDCFNDMLPLDLVSVPLMLPFLWLAFTMFAPPGAERRRRWRLAGATSGGENSIHFLALAAIGIAWCLAHLAYFPLAARFWPFFLYWSAWLAWFALGAATCWPRRSPGRI